MEIGRVTQIFDDAVRNIWSAIPAQNRNLDILNFWLKHERKGVCLHNLFAQIEAVEKKLPKVTPKEFEGTIGAAAMLFCRATLEVKTFALLSANEQQRLIAKRDRMERLRAEADASTVDIKTFDERRGKRIFNPYGK